MSDQLNFLLINGSILGGFSMEEIKSCPCCGNKAEFYQIGPKMIINCLRCGLKIERTYGNKTDIVHAWNKRVD